MSKARMAFVAMLWTATPALGADGGDPDCALDDGPTVEVARAVDAATLELVDGGQVRLLNLETPEAAWGEAAVAATRALADLVEGRRARLRFDGRRQDRHGRWLAHLTVAGEDGAAVWAQARLVEGGHARVSSFAGARACARALLGLEARARAARRGLWRRSEAAVVPAWATRTLLARLNAFQVVEGRVTAVGRTRNWTFLNFGADYRRDFTAAIAAGDRRAFHGSDIDLAALEGARVRVRGWIESWNGPAIKVTHPEQIEVLTDDDDRS